MKNDILKNERKEYVLKNIKEIEADMLTMSYDDLVKKHNKGFKFRPYIEKNLKGKDLMICIENAIKLCKLPESNEALAKELKLSAATINLYRTGSTLQSNSAVDKINKRYKNAKLKHPEIKDILTCRRNIKAIQKSRISHELIECFSGLEYGTIETWIEEPSLQNTIDLKYINKAIPLLNLENVEIDSKEKFNKKFMEDNIIKSKNELELSYILNANYSSKKVERFSKETIRKILDNNYIIKDTRKIGSSISNIICKEKIFLSLPFTTGLDLICIYIEDDTKDVISLNLTRIK